MKFQEDPYSAAHGTQISSCSANLQVFIIRTGYSLHWSPWIPGRWWVRHPLKPLLTSFQTRRNANSPKRSRKASQRLLRSVILHKQFEFSDKRTWVIACGPVPSPRQRSTLTRKAQQQRKLTDPQPARLICQQTSFAFTQQQARAPCNKLQTLYENLITRVAGGGF